MTMKIVAIVESERLLTNPLGEADVVFVTDPPVTPGLIVEANRILINRREKLDLTESSGRVVCPGYSVMGDVWNASQLGSTRAERLARVLTEAEKNIAQKEDLQRKSRETNRHGVAHWFGVPVLSEAELTAKPIADELV